VLGVQKGCVARPVAVAPVARPAARAIEAPKPGNWNSGDGGCASKTRRRSVGMGQAHNNGGRSRRLVGARVRDQADTVRLVAFITEASQSPALARQTRSV
jgi:hypothetical protein